MNRYAKMAHAAGSYAARTLPRMLAAEAWQNRGLTFWTGTGAVVAVLLVPEIKLAVEVFAAIH